MVMVRRLLVRTVLSIDCFSETLKHNYRWVNFESERYALETSRGCCGQVAYCVSKCDYRSEVRGLFYAAALS